MQTCIAIGIGVSETPRPRARHTGAGLTLRFGVPLLLAEMQPIAGLPLMRAGVLAAAGGFDSAGLVGGVINIPLLAALTVPPIVTLVMLRGGYVNGGTPLGLLLLITRDLQNG